jgi:hypothetical protein
LGIRIVDALWVAESTPMDYQKELSLAKELRTWLTQHAPAIRGAFR